MALARRAYRGRIVRMDEQFSIVQSGVIWTDGNVIASVTDAGAAPPAGFEHVAPLETNGTIYPGLIELHNHLAYNILPLWNVPEKYPHRGVWIDSDEYKATVSGPMKVVTEVDGITAAIARYTESKCLLGGTTTSQGITLSGHSQMKRLYRGVVRNVENPLDDDLPGARTKIGDVSATSVEAFFQDLKESSCMLLHLSEGLGEDARKHFLSLRLPNTNGWAITNALAGIHSAALERQDLDRMAAAGASMVWSPLSNLMLYGGTADMAAAKASGITVALGPDWGPSGSKNALHELKVARAVSAVAGGLFTDRELVAMVTRHPAQILKWPRLGSIEVGKYVDLTVLDGADGDVYSKLVDATESDIAMVVIDGTPRLARPELAKGFAKSAEQVLVSGAPRLINFDDAEADIIVAGVSLATATSRLVEALADLPALALRQQTMSQAERDAAAPSLRVVLDEEEPPGINQRTRFRQLGPIASQARSDGSDQAVIERQLVASQKTGRRLDPLTVDDDPRYWVSVLGQRNLPPSIKDALRP
jgi:cytosine/adenosine deaminase-related metal-dependent hydrolase